MGFKRMESILDFMIIHPLQTIHPILQSPKTQYPNIPAFHYSYLGEVPR